MGIAAAASAQSQAQKRYQNDVSPWPIALNTSTIRPGTLEQKIDAAAKAGYDAIEPWIDDIENHEKEGGDLKDLGKAIADKGLTVPNVIGLWSCMPEGEEAWQASLPKTRDRMRMSAAIGSQHVAAIPAPDERHDLATAVFDQRTPVGERASRVGCLGRGDFAAQHDPLPLPLE